ncbi:MAG: V-type ATP synthase subunit F [Candidatus Nanohaloarchaea archaeon]|nr:V-type ATP synthase subunit F [Candidatus Nanohaloarchaea archaeon]
MRVSVVGPEEFTLGFKLAGITAAYEPQEDELPDAVDRIMAEEEGVVIMDGGYMDALDERTRMELQNSVDPVVVPLREDAEGEDLRRKIKQAIGVDLWSED